MKTENLLPKRVVNYINEMGVRALDHLATTFQAADTAAGAAPTAVQTLLDQWKTMTEGEKRELVERVSASVTEVVAASATLPMGLKVGRQVAKVTRKVLKKKSKSLRKAAKRALTAKVVETAVESIKPLVKAKVKAKAKPKARAKPKAKAATRGKGKKQAAAKKK